MYISINEHSLMRVQLFYVIVYHCLVGFHVNYKGKQNI